MPKTARAACFVCLVALAGCGEGPPSTANAGAPPPHQGNLVPFPDGKGLVEVVKKPVASQAPAASEVSFYFFRDAYTPYTPAPTSGTLTVKKQKVALKAEGDALVTPPGPPLFGDKDVDGALTVELDGATKTIPLGER